MPGSHIHCLEATGAFHLYNLKGGGGSRLFPPEHSLLLSPMNFEGLSPSMVINSHVNCSPINLN